jgi:hypothetical protein
MIFEEKLCVGEQLCRVGVRISSGEQREEALVA